VVPPSQRRYGVPVLVVGRPGTSPCENAAAVDIKKAKSAIIRLKRAAAMGHRFVLLHRNINDRRNKTGPAIAMIANRVVLPRQHQAGGLT